VLIDQVKGIDKSILTVAAPRRYRNREHLRYVAQQACLVCGRKPSDPHHLGFTQPRALGRKVSDELARLPIIAGCPIKHASKLEPSGYCAKTWQPAPFARWPVVMAARLAAMMSLNTLRDAKGRLQ
jgi:hypothetical protein